MLLTLPLIIPLLSAICCLLLRHQPKLTTFLSLIGAIALLTSSTWLFNSALTGEVLTLAFGNWPTPYGIVFQGDRLSAIMVLVTAILALVTVLFQMAQADQSITFHRRCSFFLLIMAVNGSFLTNDIFNLYVWFELMLICGVSLMLQQRLTAIEAAIKYFILNFIGTLVLIIAISAIYAQTGALNFLAIRQAVTEGGYTNLTPAIALLMVAFLIKAACFPFSSWLPASYHTITIPIQALFAGLLTKVGLYAVLRVLSSVFTDIPSTITDTLMVVACLTMITGVLGAAYHWDIRRILSFHIISQVGYILLAISLANENSYGAALFYTIHHIIVKSNLFFVAGIIFFLQGSYDLRQLGGVIRKHPYLACIFLIPALSLIGVPPLSGFWAKYLILLTLFDEQRYLLAFIVLAVSLLTMYSMLKIWIYCFWGEEKQVREHEPKVPSLYYCAVTLLALLTLVIGLFPDFLINYSWSAFSS